MGNSIKVGARAQRTFAQLASLTEPVSSSARAELLAARVPMHTVEALYPFDLADHLPEMHEILNVRRTFQALAPVMHRAYLGEAMSTLPMSAQQAFEKANLSGFTIKRGLKSQHSSAHPNFLSAMAAYWWVDLLLYFYALSQVKELPRNSPALDGLRANEIFAQKLVEKVRQFYPPANN